MDERIHLMTGKLTSEEEVALYSMCHVYVQPSRGEGFGLRPLQAIAQGCPTIATNAHGHAAFSVIRSPTPWDGPCKKPRHKVSTTGQRGVGGSRTSMNYVRRWRTCTSTTTRL